MLRFHLKDVIRQDAFLLLLSTIWLTGKRNKILHCRNSSKIQSENRRKRQIRCP